jgi:hypothetical protein
MTEAPLIFWDINIKISFESKGGYSILFGHKSGHGKVFTS